MRRIVRQFRECEVGIAENRHQDVVEVVRDSAGEYTKAFQFLRVKHLAFELSLLLRSLGSLGHILYRS